MNESFDMRGFIGNSLLEWEDHVAAVIVAGGCNLRCPYCHSWRYVTGIADLERLDAEEAFRLLKRQRGWLDGVVFTGGEPTLQTGLEGMMRRVKREFHLPIKLHTNGTRPDVLERLTRAGLVDCLALDFKAPLDGRFFAAAGIAPDRELLESVQKTFALAAEGECAREYHTTLAPAFIDEKTFADMAEWLEPGGTWFLQQYENGDCLNPAAAGGARYDERQLEAFAATARRGHGKVILKKGTLQA